MSHSQLNAKRYFCFTINNPTSDDDKQLVDLCSSTNVRYLCYGRETGESNTPHYQGYVEFLKPQRFSWIKKRLARAHLEPKKGSRTQARDYCFKEDSAPFIYGQWKPDRQGDRNDLLAVRNSLMNVELNLDDIEHDNFTHFCRYNRYFTDFRQRHLAKRNWETKVYVFHGPTGTGKTRAAYQMPNAGQIDYCNSFFSGYNNQEVLIFDDVKNPINVFGRRLFLRITDRYPMDVNVKHGHKNWNPKVIIFTTNDNPKSWNLDAACARRIDDYVNFDASICPPPDMSLLINTPEDVAEGEDFVL